MEETIVCAFPGFALLILAEFSRGVATRRNTYRVDAAINNMSLGNLRRVTEVYTNVFQVSLYAMCYEALWPTHQTQFCSAWYGYLAAVVFVVFCGYWARRCSRNMGVLWTAHVARQQSLAFNFPTVLLLESAYPILVFVFFMTPAMLGVPPAVFAVSWLVVLLCQAWLHAERVGKLGPFDRNFSTPSDHRVSHAFNDAFKDACIDRNYGGMLIVWARIFGTFMAGGSQPYIYGTRPLLNRWDPVWAILINYRNLLLDVWHLQCRVDKTCICLKPPGWRLPDILRADPRPNVDIANVRVADPATGLLAKPSACVRILLLTGASSAVVWQAGGLSFRFEVPLVAAICAGLWAIGRVLQGGMLSHWTLIVDAAVLPCFWRFV